MKTRTLGAGCRVRVVVVYFKGGKGKTDKLFMKRTPKRYMSRLPAMLVIN